MQRKKRRGLRTNGEALEGTKEASRGDSTGNRARKLSPPSPYARQTERILRKTLTVSWGRECSRAEAARTELPRLLSERASNSPARCIVRPLREQPTSEGSLELQRKEAKEHTVKLSGFQ
jgi:hypothetical protein